MFNLSNMLHSSFKKLHLVNYFLIALILAAALLLSRDIINFSFLKKKMQLSDAEAKKNSIIIPGQKDIMYYSLILEKNPFGSPMKFHPSAFRRGGEGTHGTLSNLILVGTVVGPKNLSYAIFDDKTRPSPGNQEVFALGENVYNYGTLIRIEKTSVELIQGTDAYMIQLVDINHYAKMARIDNRSFSQTSFVKKIGKRQYLLDRRKVMQAIENPEQILTDARLLPNIQNGKQEGFKMYEVKPGGLYESLGLRNGDILLRINGLEISNPEVAIQAMSALRGMNRVDLDIIRNDSKLSMSYQIR